MKCPDFETLMLFLDGELEGDDLRSVAGHLDSCPECRRVLETQKRLEESWRDDFEYPAAMEFRLREDALFRRMNRRSIWRTLAPAAAGIIAALIGFKIIMGTRPSLDRVSTLARGRTSEEYLLEDMAEPERGGMAQSPMEDTSEDFVTMDEVTEIAGELEEAPEETLVLQSGDSMYRSVMSEEVAVAADADAVSESQQPQSVGNNSRGAGETACTVEESVEGTMTGGSGGVAVGGFGYSATEQLEQAGPPETVFQDGSAETCDDFPSSGLVDDRSGFDQTVASDMEMDSADNRLVTTIAADVEGQEAASESWQEIELFCCEEEEQEMQEEEDVMPGATHSGFFNEEDTGELVTLTFDPWGVPDSATALLLDSLSPGWRDYIHYDFKDTVMVVPLAGVSDLILNGGSMPAETME